MTKIFKVYDTVSSEKPLQNLWDKKMESIYFSEPKYFVGRILNSTIYSFLNQYLPENGLILDGGCGSNYLSQIFDSPQRKVVGLDFALSNLLEGKKKYPAALSVGGDLNYLPFADQSFDAVLSISAAEHLEMGPVKTFQESYRVLKNNGVFLLLIPTYNPEDSLTLRHRMFFKKQKEEFVEIPHFPSSKICKLVSIPFEEVRNGFFAYWFSKGAVKEMLTHSGFKIQKSFPLDILGGLARSRVFYKWAKKMMASFPIVSKRLPAEHLNWKERVFLREDIYNKRWNCLLHRFIGRFYRYHLAFVCKKP
jgi:ubiquinone/menaquinone biosynthesis C-methylase UbiE